MPAVRAVSLLLAVLLELSAANRAPGQAIAAVSGGGPGFSVAAIAAPGGQLQPLGGLNALSFLGIRWTNALEVATPRRDIPREEAFGLGTRLRLPDGSRLYRVLGPSGTAVVQTWDQGAAVLVQAAGDGLSSGLHEKVAASPFDPWAAASVIGGSGFPPRVILARTDHASGPATFDVTPPAGFPGLNPGSLSLASGALFFTTSIGELWRVPLDSRIPAIVPLPVPAGFIDPEIAVSGNGSTIAFRAGASAGASVVVALPSAGGTPVVFGNPGPKLGVTYDDPGRRPRLSAGADGSLVPFFERSGSDLLLFVGENYGLHFSPLIAATSLSLLIGIESELAIGDGNQVLTLVLPAPGGGSLTVSLPYPVLQFALGIVGQVVFQVLSNAFPLYPPGVNQYVTTHGHFTVQANGERFFLMGPSPASLDLVQLAPGGYGGTHRVGGFQSVEETVMFGSTHLVVRATPSTTGTSAAYVVPLPSGPVISSAALGPGTVRRIAGSADGQSLAILFSGPAGDHLWRLGLGVPGLTREVTPAEAIAADLVWRSDGVLLFRAGQVLQSLDSAGTITVWGEYPALVEIL